MEPDQEASNKPLHNKTVYVFGVIIALVSPATIQGVPKVPIISDLWELGVEAVMYAINRLLAPALNRILEYIFTTIVHAMIQVVGWFFLVSTHEFLFFDPPHEFTALHSVWEDFAVAFLAIVATSTIIMLLAYMLFPESDEVDIYRHFERVLVATFLVILTNPYLGAPIYYNGEWVSADLFSAAVIAVNEIGGILFPSSYGMEVMGESFNSTLGGIASMGGLGATIIGIAFVGSLLMVKIIFTIIAFYGILAMRMILVYTVYGLFPLLIGIWILDIGPFKYGKTVVTASIKIAALMLLIGILVAGVLGVTATIAGAGAGDVDDDLEFTEEDMSDAPGGIVDTDEDQINEDVTDGSLSSDEADPGFQGAMIGLFAWFAGPALAIALVTGALGMLTSMRGDSVARKMHSAKNRRYGGGSGGGGKVTQTKDGEVVIEDGPGNGGVIIDSEGDVSTFGGADASDAWSTPSSPTPENPAEVPLRDKAKNIAGWSGEKAQQAGGKAKSVGGLADSIAGWGAEKVGKKDGYDSAKDTLASMGATAEKAACSVNDSATSLDPRSNDAFKFDTWNSHGEAIKENQENAMGWMKGSAVQSVGHAGRFAVRGTGKVGNLGKRGGKAWYNVAKQPDVGASVAEFGYQLRSSPIGKPKSPKGEVDADTPGWWGDAADGEFDWGGATAMDDGDTSTDKASAGDADMETAGTPDWWSEATHGGLEWSGGSTPSPSDVETDLNGNSESQIGNADFDMDNLPGDNGTLAEALEEQDIVNGVGSECFGFRDGSDGSNQWDGASSTDSFSGYDSPVDDEHGSIPDSDDEDRWEYDKRGDELIDDSR